MWGSLVDYLDFTRTWTMWISLQKDNHFSKSGKN